MLDSLIPAVKEFIQSEGICKLSDSVKLILPEEFGAIEKFAKEKPFDIFTVETAAQNAEFINNDEYHLIIEEDSIIIEAADERICFDGLLTLKQLLKDNTELTCGAIVDWPDTPMRVYHLDCKGGFPELTDLYKFADYLIDLKFNAVLLEYENMFPYPSFPEIVRSDAPSRQDWEEFLSYLRERFVTVIPLIQTAGHLEFLLRLEKYAHLREGDNVNEICLSNTEARDVVLQLMDDVLDFHKDDHLVHIGADETWYLATCPNCEKLLAEGKSKLDIYCEHLSALIEKVKERDHRPLMWCDMFWREEHPSKVNVLPKEAILVEWVYNGTRYGSPGCYWQGKYCYSSEYAELNPNELMPNKVADLDSEAKEFLDKYWPVNIDTGLGPVSPYVEYFTENDFEVWGACAARMSESGNGFGLNLKNQIENCILWGKTARDKKMHGHITTSWSRSSTFRPQYGPWMGPEEVILAAAQYAWNAELPYDFFLRSAGFHLYGTECTEEIRTIIDNYDTIPKHPYNDCLQLVYGAIDSISEKAVRGKEHLELLRLGAEANNTFIAIDWWLSSAEKVLYRVPTGKFPMGGRGNRQEYIEGAETNCRSKIDELEKKMREVLQNYYRKEDLDEYIESRLHNYRFRLENILAELKK
ncbi:MAG: family 20 glycosylhydrolase [Planctomycetota bacterium]|jgi:hypothetical protein